MAEYIEREALEVALNHRLNFLMAENGEYDHYTSGFDEAVTRVENSPAADVAPVRHGRWIDGGDYVTTAYGSLPVKMCSECHMDVTLEDFDSYCPNCGAKMDLEG